MPRGRDVRSVPRFRVEPFFSEAIGLLHLVLEPRRAAPLAGHDDIEIAVAVEVDDRDAQARSDALVQRDRVLGPLGFGPALELIPVDARRFGRARVTASGTGRGKSMKLPCVIPENAGWHDSDQ